MVQPRQISTQTFVFISIVMDYSGLEGGYRTHWLTIPIRQFCFHGTNIFVRWSSMTCMRKFCTGEYPQRWRSCGKGSGYYAVVNVWRKYWNDARCAKESLDYRTKKHRFRTCQNFELIISEHFTQLDLTIVGLCISARGRVERQQSATFVYSHAHRPVHYI